MKQREMEYETNMEVDHDLGAIAKAEVTEVTKRLKNGKASGIDPIKSKWYCNFCMYVDAGMKIKCLATGKQK